MTKMNATSLSELVRLALVAELLGQDPTPDQAKIAR
jgi:hypothetical protein